VRGRGSGEGGGGGGGAGARRKKNGQSGPGTKGHGKYKSCRLRKKCKVKGHSVTRKHSRKSRVYRTGLDGVEG